VRPKPVAGYLTSEEWDACQQRARAVSEIDTKAKVVDRLVSHRDPIYNSACGYAAEVVVARYLDAHPDWSTDVHNIRKFDLWFHGYRVEVKWSPGPRISIAGHTPAGRCDLYVAVQGFPPLSLLMSGWLWAKTIHAPAFWNEKAPRPCWQVHADDMLAMADLLTVRRNA
jgi:hypothetical protein